MTTAAQITKTDLINSIIEEVEEFGIDNINETTTVFVNKSDYTDVEVADAEFNTFTEAHATMASFFVDFDGDSSTIDRREIRLWIESFDTEIE